jgi:hypothetical protein
MSSACDGDAIAASPNKKRGCGIGPPARLSLPYIARQIVSPQTKLHFDEERVAIVTDDAASGVGCASLSQEGLPRLRNGAQAPSPASAGSTGSPDTIG